MGNAYRDGEKMLPCLAMELPLPEARLKVQAPVPDDLAQVLSRLPWWEQACAAEPRLTSPGCAELLPL